MIFETGYGPFKHDSVLEALSSANVLTITKLPDGRFDVVEHCDDHFFLIMTKEQLLVLAEELQVMAEKA